MDHPCIDTDAIINRFKRIEGQLRGLIKMVEEKKPCEEILIQIGSAKAALHKSGQVVLESHLRHCIFDNLLEGNDGEAIKRLTGAVEQFSRIV